MKEKLYRPRVIDNVIQRYLKIAGAICIEGPKWCVKLELQDMLPKVNF